ncbi:LacI family DNA-binding transcriptional regulator [Mucilaginibacter antarcticus]|uniref:LacI family DNA-binding transcriptional regulator n=1 Tax=Mucilaginibacter antarcticus TaxID=1855725 RepID=UPI0036399C35
MKKVGLKDIAEHVGVSIALVSYVLNGQAEQKQVSKDNAAKIKKAAEELNYRPNQIAKSLKMLKTNTIGLVVADINYRFSTGITRAIEAEAKRKTTPCCLVAQMKMTTLSKSWLTRLLTGRWMV